MFSRFHDGFFNGLLISGESVCVFISTVDNERYALHAAGVVALLSEQIRAGNIILDVQIKSTEEIDREDVREVHGFPGTEQGDQWAEKGLQDAKTAGLSLLVINPSYGGRCLALANSFMLVSENECVTRPSGLGDSPPLSASSRPKA